MTKENQTKTLFERKVKDSLLIRQMKSLSEKQRTAGLYAYDALPIERKRVLLERLLASYPNLLQSVLWTNFWCAIIPLLLAFLINELLMKLFGLGGGALFAFIPAGLIFAYIHLKRTDARLKILASLLDRSEDLGLLPVVLRSMGRHGEALYLPLTRFVNRNLPNANVETLQSWSGEERASVLHILTLENRVPAPMLDEAMRLKGIELMASFGGWDTLRVLEEISLGFHSATPLLRRSAADAIPQLREKLEAADRIGTLLRSSKAPMNLEALVRPAFGRKGHSEEELLRPL